MINSDLLIVAKGMGLDASLKSNETQGFTECVVIGYAGFHYTEDCNIFNPTEGELMKWLLGRGVFTLVQDNCVKYMSRYEYMNNANCMESRESDLKQNLLNIVLQVVNDKARYLEGES